MSPLWGANGAANTSLPKWVAYSIGAGSGAANQAANNISLFNNTTPNAFVNTEAVGTIALTTTKVANGSSGAAAKAGQTGWNLRRAYQGPVLTLVANSGSGFANNGLETVLLSNGTSNGSATLTPNATGNIASATITSGGLFTNANMVAFTFMRQKHVANVTSTSGSGYANTDYIVVSNGTVDALAVLSSVNATGGFQNNVITVTNVGLFGNTQSNTDVVITVYAANGAASNGSGATLAANLQTSTGGSVDVGTMGGRAGRVTYETLVAMSTDFVDASANTAP